MPSRSTFLLVLIVHAVIIGAWFATAGGMFREEAAQTPPSDPWQAHWVDLDDSLPAQVSQLNAKHPVLALKGKSKPATAATTAPAAPTPVVKPAADLPPAPPAPVHPAPVVVNDPPSTPRVAKALPADSSAKSKSAEKSGESPSSKTASTKAATPVVKERTPAKTETSKPATTAKTADDKKPSTKPEVTKTPPAKLPKRPETATRNERDAEPRPERNGDSRDFSAYRSAIRSSFHENWEQPRGLFVSPDQPVVTQVRATIARDGTVLKRRITDPSGLAEMDDSVEAAIKSVRRIAPLPKEMSGDTYEVDITFRLR